MMDYAIMMHFDPISEACIRDMIDRLAEHGGVNSTYRDTGMRPHVTLAEFNTPHYDDVRDVLQRFTTTWPSFPIRIDSVGIFPQPPAVLFYAPIVDDVLLAFHRNLNVAIKRFCTDFSAHYQDRNWVAHCTLALNLTTPEVQNGIAFLSHGFEAIEAHFAGIDVFVSEPFRCLESFPLSNMV